MVIQIFKNLDDLTVGTIAIESQEESEGVGNYFIIVCICTLICATNGKEREEFGCFECEFMLCRFFVVIL